MNAHCPHGYLWSDMCSRCRDDIEGLKDDYRRASMSLSGALGWAADGRNLPRLADEACRRLADFRQVLAKTDQSMLELHRIDTEAVEKLRTALSRCADAAADIAQVFENSRRAESKGSAPYTAEFAWACVAPCIDRIEKAALEVLEGA